MKGVHVPFIGAMAEHRVLDLDPREVTAISDNGREIKIWILTAESDWLPASNYTYHPKGG